MTEKMTGLEKEKIKRIFNELWKCPDEDPYRLNKEDKIIKRKIKILKRIIRDFHVKSILDLGCGGGDFMELLLTETNMEFYIAGIDKKP